MWLQKQQNVKKKYCNSYHSYRNYFRSSYKNLYKKRVDYKEVLKEVVVGRKLIRATAYVIKTETEEEMPFFEALSQL